MVHKRAKYYSLENVMKGAANHRRIEILQLLAECDDLSTDDIVERLDINYQTGAAHVRRLMRSDLIYGHRQGNTILHDLTDRGKSIIKLLEKLK